MYMYIHVYIQMHGDSAERLFASHFSLAIIHLRVKVRGTPLQKCIDRKIFYSMLYPLIILSRTKSQFQNWRQESVRATQDLDIGRPHVGRRGHICLKQHK